MKALNKGKAAQLFKKQQKKQNIDQIIYDAESKTIASQVGIAQEEIQQFKWFFDQIAKFKLPSNYQKVLNDKKSCLFYRQRQSKIQTLIHPCLDLIKSFFYEGYKSNRSTFTFQKKKQKLLPYVEQKMMKNCMSLNSKRRQVEKLNLQKDENGNTVLSKMARLKPDIKSLISARSYMLKMLVEKVYTYKQIWGKGKRARAYAGILNEKEEKQEEEEDEVKEQDLEVYQRIFGQAGQFYEEQYGDLKGIPKSVKESDEYKKSTPENVIRNLMVLNISKNQIEYFWFARLMDCLKLPYNWTSNFTNSFPSYTYEPLKLKFDIHPSYIYIITQMNQFKLFFINLQNSQKSLFYQNRQMTFYDFFERQYTVDIFGLALRQQLKNQRSSSGKEQKRNQQNDNDWLVVEGVLNSQIRRDYILVEKLIKYWTRKCFEQEEWIPSISPFGEVIWSSTVNYSSISFCPYKQGLKRLIEEQRRKLPTIKAEDFKEHIKKDLHVSEQGIQVKQQSESRMQLFEIARQRQIFLEYYLDHINKPLPTPFFINNYQERDYFDQIFISPFELDQRVQFINFGRQQISEQEIDVPVWIKKVRAKKFECKIKNNLSLNRNFQQIKNELYKYSIETTLKQEPYRAEQIEQQLRNIKNTEEMKRFIEEFNNINLREQRKRKVNQRLDQKQINQDNIFGSDQSNLDPQQAVQSQQSQYSESSSEQQRKEEQENKKEQGESEEISEQSSVSEIQSEKEDVQEEEMDVKSEGDMQFLQNFYPVSYQTSSFFDKITHSTLNQLFRSTIKRFSKKFKFTPSHLKAIISSNLKTISNHQNISLASIQKNLIITNLTSLYYPYKQTFSFLSQPFKNISSNTVSIPFLSYSYPFQKKSHSQFDPIDKIVDIDQYFSQIDDISIDQIQAQIKNIPKKNNQKVENSSQKQNPQVRIIQNKQKVTQFILQPIKRTKPDILLDPYLKHINFIDSQNDIDKFKRSFKKNNKQQEDKTIQKIRIKRSRSVSNIICIQKVRYQQKGNVNWKIKSQKKGETYQNQNDSKLQERESVKRQKYKSKRLQKQKQQDNFRSQKSVNKFRSTQIKFSSPNNLQNIDILSKKKLLDDTHQSTIFNKSISNFNRVCLNHTASSFLSSQSIKKQSQLLILQARKSLIHQSRGLPTYLSKKY